MRIVWLFFFLTLVLPRGFAFADMGEQMEGLIIFLTIGTSLLLFFPVLMATSLVHILKRIFNKSSAFIMILGIGFFVAICLRLFILGEPEHAIDFPDFLELIQFQAFWIIAYLPVAIVVAFIFTVERVPELERISYKKLFLEQLALGSAIALSSLLLYTIIETTNLCDVTSLCNKFLLFI
ncbi:MAG: hypothetical protein AAB372_04500 [Patescibacteria group bacterium]